MKHTCKEIRSEFIDFFVQRGHRFVPSSSVLPAEDPTLLFTNAGMNQFKDIFLGLARRDYVRAVNSQKCIRAGGKHNDLEDVGHDTYHHTFFEMLGNWSFGDYFKAEAIQWAWELLTKVWQLPRQRLHVTVFGGDKAEGLAPDDEARELWTKLTDIDASHIHTGNKKDNFWEMGETGPCGPCSEIHYDFTPDLSGGKLVNAGDARVVEIWNLVFMQFNRGGDGKLNALPAKHVDTGMGLERIARILQGVDSNYDIDIFRGLFAAVAKAGASKPYGGKLDDMADTAYRVVADHIRTLTFAIADGVIPSNEGRGYVLRRILRRAARYGRQYLGIDGPFMFKLVPTVTELMGEDFGELKTRQQYVIDTIRGEEESFGKTLDRGIDLFERQAEKLAHAGVKQLPGELAFDLYATYGFPVDLTQLMAAELGLKVDTPGFEAEMARHREISAGTGEKFKAGAIANLPPTDDSAKYAPSGANVPPPLAGAKVLGWVIGEKFITDGQLQAGQEAAVILDRTNFYGEQGGQVGDTGRLIFEGGAFVVRDTVLAGQSILHVGVVEQGALRAGAAVTASVGSARLDTMRNHTATHLLNWALREVLGEHANQAGSVVAPDRLRFDFSHNTAMTVEQLKQVESMVNDLILEDYAVEFETLPLATARAIPRVRAMFGEKYPDPVRVVKVVNMAIGWHGGRSMPPCASGAVAAASAATPSGTPASQTAGATGGLDTRMAANIDRHATQAEVAPGDANLISAEFCGGTHLSRTGIIGLFKIIAEESVAKGVRRITALTGHEAVRYVQQLDESLKGATSLLRTAPAELAGRIAAMQKEIKELRKAPKAAAAASELENEQTVATPAGSVLVAATPLSDVGEIRNLCDRLRQKGHVAVFLGSAAEGKVTLIAMVSDDLAKAGKLKAGDWVKAIAPLVGGSGGGKPTLAQAGGKQPENLPAALKAAGDFAKEKLG